MKDHCTEWENADMGCLTGTTTPAYIYTDDVISNPVCPLHNHGMGESIWLLIAYNKINATLTKEKLSQVNQACKYLELELNGCLVAMIPSFIPKIHMTKICSP